MLLLDLRQGLGNLKLYEILHAFQEKPQLKQGRINGGFCRRTKIWLYKWGWRNVGNSSNARAIKNNDVAAYETDSFWRCVDSKDLDYVQKLWEEGNAKWAIY